MKTLLYTLAAAILAASTPAMAQEVRLGADFTTSGRNEVLSPRVEVNNFRLNTLGAGVEGRTSFGEGVDEVTGKVGGRLGNDRFNVTPTLQFGAANVNNDGRGIFATVGAGAEGRISVLGPVDLVGDVTYRQALAGRDRYRLTEYRAGADLNINPRFAIGARYFNRDGTLDSSGVSAGVTVRL